MLNIKEIVKATSGRQLSGSKTIAIKDFSIDSRAVKNGDCFIAIKGENFDGHDFLREVAKKKAACIIVDKTSKLPVLTKDLAVIRVKDTQIALGLLAAFIRLKYNTPVIAVTGSVGKTTAKEMLAWVLSKKYKVLFNEGTKNNHIGLPLTLLRLKPEHDLAVLELGTNHFGEIDYLAKISLPNIGIITNIGPAHLEHFKNLAGVLKEKSQIIKRLKAPGVSFLNADDQLLSNKFLKTGKNNFFSFGIKNNADYKASNIKIANHGLEFSVNNKCFIKLDSCGKNNIYNALIAVAVARVFGMDYKEIALRISKFKFPKGRLNIIKLKQVKFLDDTYNANPLSLKAALEAVKNINVEGRKIFVMGDMLELGDSKESLHSGFGRDIAQICDIFISVGNLSKLAAQAAKVSGLNVENIYSCRDSLEARELLFNKVSPDKDDIVLVKGSRGMKMEEIFKI